MAVQDVQIAATHGMAGINGTMHFVQTPAGVLYAIYNDASHDVVFKKSADNGATWSGATVIYAGASNTAIAVWYDRWSGLSADLIHCVYCDQSGADDVLYRSINAASADALGTETVVFDGLTAGITGDWLSITRTRGGNLICAYCIDTGAEHGTSKSTDVGATWSPITSLTEASGAGDRWLLMPGFAADSNDAIAIFWDASADEISRKLYDDDLDSWGETSIATSMVESGQSTRYADMAAAVDLTNSRIVMVAWSDDDAANADLRCWTVTESAIETTTNVVLNSVDDQGMCAIAIDTDTGDWYVFYAGKSDGSETFATSLTVNYKVSTDDGATWGAETAASGSAISLSNTELFCCPRFTSVVPVGYNATGGPVYVSTVDTAAPPDAPVISATGGNTIVTLSWAAVDDADTYSIYRGTSSGSHSLIQSLYLSTSFVDTGLTNGQTYYYVVTATSSAGESDDSNEVQATPTNQVTLTPVTGFSGFPVNQRTIPVDWNRVKKRLQRRDEEELLFILGITDRPPNRR